MKKYNIEEVFNIIGKDYLTLKNQMSRMYDKNADAIVEGYKVRKISLRYMTFYQKGVDCVCCNRKGSYFLLEGDDNNPLRRHFNLYTEDDVLMTKDHIIPKSKGGKDNVDNMQPMCIICNEKKKNNISFEVTNND